MSHHGGRGYTKTKQIRSERRVLAEQVAAESGFSKLTTQQKLDQVRAFAAIPGNGNAAKQIKRLEALLLKEQAPKPEPKVKGVGRLDPNRKVQDKSPVVVSPEPEFDNEDDVEGQHNKRGKRSRWR